MRDSENKSTEVEREREGVRQPSRDRVTETQSKAQIEAQSKQQTVY